MRLGFQLSPGHTNARRLFLACAIALFGVRFAAAEPTLVLDDVVAQARALVVKDVVPKVPGAAVAVAVDGKIVWSQGFGYADLATHKLVTPATRFRIGSVSKALSSAGFALLVERGQLKLDEPVQTYLPDFPRGKGVITLRELAGHLSGIRNYQGHEMFLDTPFANLASGLKLFENDPLESVPGTHFSYSSYNWNVIGAAMERVTKRDFPSFMEENVFKPLGMSATRADRAGVADAQRAQFYEIGFPRSFVAAPAVDSSYKWPSGGFLSTAEDLDRFGSALLTPGFLKPESLRLLFTTQKTSAGLSTHYGVGWFLDRTSVFHGGDSVGGTAVLLIQPASGVVVAIVCNRGHLTVKDRLSEPRIAKADDRFSSGVLVKAARRIATLFAPLAKNAAPPAAK